MGFLIGSDDMPDAFPYTVEVRRESFCLSGSPNWTWSRIDPDTNERVFWDGDDRPEGNGWECNYHERRHAIHMYPVSEKVHQGTVEILLEDIPKLRAALDAVEQHIGAYSAIRGKAL